MRRLILIGVVATLARAGSVHAASEEAKQDGPQPPAAKEMSYVYDIFDHSLVRPVTRVLDVARIARKVSGNRREAVNVDASDQVLLPSTWWQPRVGFRTVTVEQMLKGPGPGTGPAPGKWTVTATKEQGVSYGFQIKDSEGDKFVIKLDHKGYPELGSAAAAIGSRLFWAAGYNVPDDVVAFFSVEDLQIAKDATYTDKRRRKRPITLDYVKTLLARAEVEPDGRYRCVASRFLKGKPLGPFQYRGRREDDPEDRVPHELRRELRGFWAMCAWTNHTDSRAPNSLDMWVTDGGRSFVRHHFIDFSSILGAGPDGKRFPSGTEYYADWGVASRQVVTAGLTRFRWEKAEAPPYRGAGHIESKTFSPEGWRPDYPNPAFDDRTERDNRWGARILAGFTDEHIRAAVAMAKYTDPRTADYIARTLMERRDKLVARWLGYQPRPEIVSR